MAITIRGAGAADRDRIYELVRSAFGRVDEANLVNRLHDDGDTVFALVAVDPPETVGYILFSRLEAPFRALALAPVAVAPGRQGAGIGSRLIRAGLARAAAGGWEAVFVVGDFAYYRRFGFDAELAAGFETPYPGPYFMVRALTQRLPAIIGRIAYPSAFAEPA